MVFEAGNRRFSVVQRILEGKVNNVYICFEEQAVARTYYTLLEMKNRDMAKTLVVMLSQMEDKSFCQLTFMNGENLCFLLAYRTPRPMEDFFQGGLRSRYVCEELTLKVVMECIDQEKAIPYSVMEMILKQKNVNLTQEGSVHFTYCLDFYHFNPNCTEQECVTALAALSARLLRQQQGVRGGAFELIERKIHRKAYDSFSQLYHDIRVTAVAEKRVNPWKRFKAFLRRNKDRMFKFLLVFSIFLMILALISLISFLIFGESFFTRLLFSAFEKIGTESMMKGS